MLSLFHKYQVVRQPHVLVEGYVGRLHGGIAGQVIGPGERGTLGPILRGGGHGVHARLSECEHRARHEEGARNEDDALALHEPGHAGGVHLGVQAVILQSNAGFGHSEALPKAPRRLSLGPLGGDSEGCAPRIHERQVVASGKLKAVDGPLFGSRRKCGLSLVLGGDIVVASAEHHDGLGALGVRDRRVLVLQGRDEEAGHRRGRQEIQGEKVEHGGRDRGLPPFKDEEEDRQQGEREEEPRGKGERTQNLAEQEHRGSIEHASLRKQETAPRARRAGGLRRNFRGNSFPLLNTSVECR